MKPSVATMMITRKCVHKCESCLIYRKDSVDLSPIYWIGIGKELHRKWNIHVNMYGGEPLCYKGFEDIIRQYSYYGISYSINTCSKPLSPEKAKLLIKSGLTNWTASVDSLRDSRSLDGINALKLFKNTKDLMVETVIFPGKALDAYNVVNFAISKKYWISVSALSFGMGPAYDSFPQIKPEWTELDIKNIRCISDKLRSYEKNHCPNEYLDLLSNKDFLYQNYKRCNGNPIIFNPDHDGTMRLCRDIAGNLVRKWTMFGALEEYDRFCQDWKADYNQLCQGCNWGCLYFAESREEIIKHV